MEGEGKFAFIPGS